MRHFPYEFVGTVQHHFLGRLRYTVLWLPEALAAVLPLSRHPRLRISGELNEQPFSGAWQPSRGRWYLMLGRPLLKAANLSLGDEVEVRFGIEAQDELVVPQTLKEAIESRPGAAQIWATLSVGKRRAVVVYVDGAKTGITLVKRLGQVVRWLEDGAADLRQLNKITIES
jgi:hypothetical protein